MITTKAFNYDHQEVDYHRIRKEDSFIATIIFRHLSECKTILNVGAGTGSYEPANKKVVAVEPSETMRRKRISMGLVPAVNAHAGQLPFDSDSFDACTAFVTIHHWDDLEKGLLEMKRVARKEVVILTFDPERLNLFWNVHYFPELVEIERKRYPMLTRISSSLGEGVTEYIPIPLQCTDGFQEAFFGRPEEFLRPEVRRAQSAWSFLPPGKEEELCQRLQQDLNNGEWDQRFGKLRKQNFFHGALCLLRFTVQ